MMTEAWLFFELIHNLLIIFENLYFGKEFLIQNPKCFITYDLSIASTKTKYIKLNAKTQNIFCRLNDFFFYLL